MTESTRPPAPAPAGAVDPLESIDSAARARLTAIADLLIPAAHGMPSAADILTDDRLRFVLKARPDLVAPLGSALGAEFGDDLRAGLDVISRQDPAALGALHLVIVAGYYTDPTIRDLIEYPGQMAIEVKTGLYPPYLEEGLIDPLLSRGPIWRDPSTGRRAVAAAAPRRYDEPAWAALGTTEGGHHDYDGT